MERKLIWIAVAVALTLSACEQATTPTPVQSDREQARKITGESLRINSGRIVFTGQSTLPDGTCLQTQLFANDSPVTWWPKDTCAVVQAGGWRLVVRLGAGGTPDELDPAFEYVLRVWQRDDPSVEMDIFPFDLMGPPPP